MFDTDQPPAPVLPLERLEHEIVQLAAHVNAGMSRWLEMVAEYDEREGWGNWGCRSCAEWIAWRCALDPRSAREHVRVARRLRELPGTRRAFADGSLSYSKARAITRVAEDNNEDELLELAEHATAAQLDRIVRGVRRMSTDDARDALAARHLSTWWERDGSLSINANLPAEEAEAFLVALDAMHDLIRARARGGSAEPPASSAPGAPVREESDRGSAEPREPRAATNADALAAMAEMAVEAAERAPDGPGRGGGERHQVVVHIAAAALGSEGRGVSRVAGGSALAPETVRRLACDCSLVPLVEDGEGVPLSVGRRSRSVPPSLSRALRARDGTCSFPGCEARRFLQAHHIRHWAHGGETSARNLTLLCGHHHRLVHEGGCSVERTRDGTVAFRDRHGTPLRPAPTPPRGRPQSLPRPSRTPSTGSGERMDLDLTLMVLGSRMAPAGSA